MALGKCVEDVFVQMSKEALRELKALISSAKTALTALRAVKTALAASMDISLIPLQVKREILENAIAVIRQGTKIIPQELILQCPDVGAVNTVIERSLSSPLEAASNMVFDIDQLMAQKAAANAEVAQIDAANDFFTELETSIDTVLNS